MSAWDEINDTLRTKHQVYVDPWFGWSCSCGARGATPRLGATYSSQSGAAQRHLRAQEKRLVKVAREEGRL